MSVVNMWVSVILGIFSVVLFFKQLTDIETSKFFYQ